MKLVAVCVSLVALASGCAAQVGDTNLNLHQGAVFANGTACRLAEFQVSEVDNVTAKGPPKVPGRDVTVSVEISNAGPPVSAADVVMRFSYRGDRDIELRPAEVASTTSVIASGTRGRVSKTYTVENTPELFRSRALRIVVDVPTYPSITFSGPKP